MLEEFEAHLRRSNLSENTISSYLLTIRMYQQLSGETQNKTYWRSRDI